MNATIGVWLGAITTVMILSYLWGDNELFKFAEHVFVGLGAGHSITMAFGNIRDSAFKPLINQNRLLLIVPIILGLMLYARFNRKFSYLSRWGVAFMVGIGTGVLMRGLPSAQVLSQLRATMLPLTALDNIIIVLGTLGGITYFLFTIKGNKAVSVLSTFGIYAMMICFGVAFGGAVFQRTSQAAGAIMNVLKLFGR